MRLSLPQSDFFGLKRRPTEGSRLIITGRSTTFDNYSGGYPTRPYAFALRKAPPDLRSPQ